MAATARPSLPGLAGAGRVDAAVLQANTAVNRLAPALTTSARYNTLRHDPTMAVFRGDVIDPQTFAGAAGLPIPGRGAAPGDAPPATQVR